MARSSGSTPSLIPHDLQVTGKITGVTNPTAAQDVATKSYVDSVATGLQVKTAVRVATTVAGTLASSFANGQTVDGIVLATGDRILIKNQATASENGIYVVAASGAPTRATDADAGSELVGALVSVTAGSQLGTSWVQTTPSPITLGSSSIVWSVFTAGTGVAAPTEPLVVRATAVAAPIATLHPCVSVTVTNGLGNERDLLVGDASGQPYRLQAGQSVDLTVTDASLVYAHGDGWPVLAACDVLVSTPTPRESDAVLSLPPLVRARACEITQLTVTADLEDVVPMRDGLRLLGWSAQSGANGCQLLLKDGDTLSNSQTVAVVTLAPNDSGGRHLPWGGVDCSGGLTIDLISGDCAIVLETGVW